MSARPRTPVAPATNTFITAPFVAQLPHRHDGDTVCDSGEPGAVNTARAGFLDSSYARLHNQEPEGRRRCRGRSRRGRRGAHGAETHRLRTPRRVLLPLRTWIPIAGRSPAS